MVHGKLLQVEAAVRVGGQALHANGRQDALGEHLAAIEGSTEACKGRACHSVHLGGDWGGGQIGVYWCVDWCRLLCTLAEQNKQPYQVQRHYVGGRCYVGGQLLTIRQ